VESALTMRRGDDATRVEHEHADKLVHDPALVELLHLVVLFHVERVHDRHDADELGLSGEENFALRDDDRALNLELTEGRDASSANTSSLKRKPVTLRSQV
jgi:hypothetical protein